MTPGQYCDTHCTHPFGSLLPSDYQDKCCYCYATMRNCGCHTTPVTPHDVLTVGVIEEIARDDIRGAMSHERRHQCEDFVMRLTLRAIAHGHPEPARIAEAALAAYDHDELRGF